MVLKQYPSSRRAAVAIVCCLFALSLITSAGCGRKTPVVTGPAPADAEQIKELVGHLARKRKMGMGIDNMQIVAANRLGEIGPPAAEHGAVPALEKLLNDKDPKVKTAAEEALKKIKGS